MEPLAPAAFVVPRATDQTSTTTTAENGCRRRLTQAAILSLSVALILQAFCWGFTVDDAWIVSRVAFHGATTGTFSVNLSGPVTDAVTPFGFAHVLGWTGKLFGFQSALSYWYLARWVGAAAFALSIAGAGLLVALDNPPHRWWWGAPLAVLCLPAAAWSGAGLSTSIVGALMLAGARLVEGRRAWAGGLVLGLGVGWRPELFPFAVTVIAVRHVKRMPERAVTLACLALVPALVACARSVLFERWLPLASVAKPPDLGSGVFYSATTLLWSGLGLLLMTRNGAWADKRAWPWLVHLAALVYAGGDWMPALRLSAPLMPWMVWSIGRQLGSTKPLHFALLPAVGFPLALAISQGEDWRRVAERRLALVEQGRAHLRQASRVATVDLGWVGLATEAHLVDLAGVTDPRIAPLLGGHTSKNVSPGLFSDRNVDTWVIRALDRNYVPGDPLQTVIAAYLVDARLLARNSDLGFVGVATVPLAGTNGQYVIARRVELATR